MKIKALLSFTGAVTMHPGEERTVSDKTGKDLVQAGLAIKLDEPEEPKTEEPKTEETKTEETKTEEPKTEETKAEEPKTEETKAVNKPLKEKAAKEA